MKKLILLLCLPFISQAQLSSNLSKKFPAHIIYAIDAVASKVKLTEDQQIKIGLKLFTMDSLANISLKKGEAIEKLNSYYTVDTNFLKSILSASELDSYGYEINKDNRFLAALNFASELKLDPTQISKIRHQNDSITSTKQISSKETIRIYNQKLNNILAKDQYVSLLKIIYKEKSIEDANKDWVKIKQLQLIADENDIIDYNKIINYHIAKNSYLDEKAERYDKPTRERLINKISVMQPSILIHSYILSDESYLDNTYSSIIKYEKALQLTKTQTDTVLKKYSQLEKIKLENKENELSLNTPVTVPSEYESIAKTLTPDQVDIWLIHKNQKAATKKAIESWNKLNKEGLTQNLDKENDIKTFINYHLSYQIAMEKIKIYNTQESILSKRAIDEKKPELLKQLDALNRNKNKNATLKNALTW